MANAHNDDGFIWNHNDPKNSQLPCISGISTSPTKVALQKTEKLTKVCVVILQHPGAARARFNEGEVEQLARVISFWKCVALTLESICSVSFRALIYWRLSQSLRAVVDSPWELQNNLQWNLTFSHNSHYRSKTVFCWRFFLDMSTGRIMSKQCVTDRRYMIFVFLFDSLDFFFRFQVSTTAELCAISSHAGADCAGHVKMYIYVGWP